MRLSLLVLDPNGSPIWKMGRKREKPTMTLSTGKCDIKFYTILIINFCCNGKTFFIISICIFVLDAIYLIAHVVNACYISFRKTVNSDECQLCG